MADASRRFTRSITGESSKRRITEIDAEGDEKQSTQIKRKKFRPTLVEGAPQPDTAVHRVARLDWHPKSSSDAGPSAQHTRPYSDPQEVTFSPDSAKQSALNFGQEIFQHGIFDSDTIYDMYVYSRQPERELTEDEKNDYLQQIKQSSINNKKEVYSFAKIEPESDRLRTDKLLDRFPQGKDPATGNEVGFYFGRARDESKRQESQSRLSLRLNPLRAAEVFDYILSELVSNHSDVISAKLTGPSHIHKRTDSIIIYLKERNEQTAYEIAQHLNEKFDDTFFCPGVPVGMYEMFSGIGYAEKLDPSSRSHGDAIAKAIASAMASCSDYVKRLNKSITKQELQKSFEEDFLLVSLQEKGINPDMPYKSAN